MFVASGSTEEGPLSGLLIADFSRILAGPYATMLLADLGAEVIKVESPGGDDTRSWTPPDRNDVATYYLSINRNKRSIVLDLKNDEDLRLARELARRADVMIENFRPGGLDRYGLDYDTVRASNPELIYASITGFGTAGGRSLAGYDLLAQAMSGLMSLTGPPDGPAYRSGISLFDIMCGMHAAIGILSALHHRSGGGSGQRIEVNLLSSALNGLVNHSTAYVAGGTVPYRMGNEHPSVYPYEPMPTADNDLIIIAANDGQFRTLCSVLGLDGIADDERFRHNSGRTANREQLRALLVDKLKQRGAREWWRELTAAGVACGPINTVDGGVEVAEELGLDPVVQVGGIPMIRNPIGMSSTPARHLLPPPDLDEHGAEIRRWLAESDQ